MYTSTPPSPRERPLPPFSGFGLNKKPNLSVKLIVRMSSRNQSEQGRSRRLCCLSPKRAGAPPPLHSTPPLTPTPMLLFTGPVTELTVNLSDKYTRGGIASVSVHPVGQTLIVLQAKLFEQSNAVRRPGREGGIYGRRALFPGRARFLLSNVARAGTERVVPKVSILKKTLCQMEPIVQAGEKKRFSDVFSFFFGINKGTNT